MGAQQSGPQFVDVLSGPLWRLLPQGRWDPLGESGTTDVSETTHYSMAGPVSSARLLICGVVV